jgi:hypothetical protein
MLFEACGFESHRAHQKRKKQGRLAQLAERLVYIQKVEGSRPSSPTNMERNRAETEKLPAQIIIHRIAALNRVQFMGRENKELESMLREQIEIWGGLTEIEDWLNQNDPGHDVPSDLEGLDWSWLNNSPG